MNQHDPPLDLTGKIKKLGEHPCAGGSYGDVYECLYDSNSGTIKVAVKALRFNLTMNEGETLLDSFRRELGIWRRLDHPNIVPFLGTTSGFGPYTSMVAMWMPNGTLQAFLKKHKDELSISDQFGLLQGIAAGLEYLHSRSVIHGDLSPNNVLIDEQNRPCLVDFGFSSVIGDTPLGLTYLQWATQRPGTIRWAAPDQFLVKDGDIVKATTKSDVYSFGCMMLQVLSGREPWSEVNNVHAVILKLSQGGSPGRPSSRAIEDRHWAVIKACWRPAVARFSATEVVGEIEKISNVLKELVQEDERLKVLRRELEILRIELLERRIILLAEEFRELREQFTERELREQFTEAEFFEFAQRQARTQELEREIPAAEQRIRRLTREFTGRGEGLFGTFRELLGRTTPGLGFLNATPIQSP